MKKIMEKLEELYKLATEDEMKDVRVGLDIVRLMFEVRIVEGRRKNRSPR